ncbi:MAG: NfeD family protein [Desulfovibrio sp.]|nr:NfeD family protein [Desulfovibrio sp.]
MSGPLFWLIVALVFLGIELAAPHLVLIFFAVGALGALCADVLHASVAVQLVIFLLISFSSLLLLRKRLRSIFGGKSRKTTDRDVPDHPLLGRQGVLRQELGSGLYEVEIDGSFWRARSASPLASGCRVTVTGFEDGDPLLVRVEPLQSFEQKK